MTTQTNSKRVIKNLNKPAYALFVLGGLYFLMMKDFSQATMFLGLALAFDPFDTSIRFNNRPLYQKEWLLVHLAATYSVLIDLFTK